MVLQLIIMTVFGLICAAIASSKGRNVIGWFFVGFFFTLIGLVITLVMSDLKKEQSQREQAERERLRLREQLRQERLKNESFRQYTTQRLDAHDSALSLDTKQAGADTKLIGELTGREQGAASAVEILWHYAVEGQTFGPVTMAELRDKFLSSELGAETLVWREGLEKWVAAHSVPEFATVVEL